jgi:general secretion pathway protein I
MKKRNRAFTLLEIMIALAVFTVASAALVKSAARTVKQTRLIEDKTVAYWIAENQLQQMRATPRGPETFPRNGTDRFLVTMASQEWEVTVQIAGTENEDVSRVEVSVATEQMPDAEVASLSGFVGRY